MKTLRSRLLSPALALLTLGTTQLHAQFLTPVLPPHNSAARALALPVASTNTIIVTSDDDSGPGTLRQAIADAAPGDTIRFALNRSKSFGFDGSEAVYLKYQRYEADVSGLAATTGSLDNIDLVSLGAIVNF